MYSQRAGPLNVFGPRRVCQPAVLFDDLPPISIVSLSHNHYNHCDLPTLRRLGRRFDPIDDPLRALDEACRARNIPRARFRTLGFGESARLAKATG